METIIETTHGLQNDTSNDNVEVQQQDPLDIPKCEGVPWSLWITKLVTLLNEVGPLEAEGICHSVSFELVLCATTPLGDLHIPVQISKTLSSNHVLDEWRYSVRAWLIEYVYYNGSSLRDDEIRYKYN